MKITSKSNIIFDFTPIAIQNKRDQLLVMYSELLFNKAMFKLKMEHFLTNSDDCAQQNEGKHIRLDTFANSSFFFGGINLSIESR